MIQAQAAARQGADIIAVIRTTAQSLLDYVPYGPTTEGFGGTYATQENFRIMRKALDDSEEVSIYKQYVSAFGLGWQVDEKTKLHFDATDALQQPLQYAKALENDKNGESQEGK